MNSRWIMLALALVAQLSTPPYALAALFTPGNLVVLQVGGTTSSAQTVTLQEYSTSGASGASLTLNSSGAGTKLTQRGNDDREGGLSLSSDRGYLVLTGYNVAAGASVAGTSERVAAFVDFNGTVNYDVVPAYSGQAITSAAALSGATGSKYWTAGSGGGTGGSNGIRYGVVDTAGSTRVVAPGGVGVRPRVVQIFDGRIYYSSDDRIRMTTPSLPEVESGTTVTDLVTGLGEARGFVLLDRDSSVAGLDTLYIADISGGLRKYSFDGTTWTARGTVATNIIGITGVVSGSTAELYVTTGTGVASGSELRRFIDTAAFNATISGSYTTLATAAAGTVFRGVAFAPIPEPSSFVLGGLVLVLGGCGCVARRWRPSA